MSVALAADWLNTSATFGETNLPGVTRGSALLWWPYPYDCYRPYYSQMGPESKPIKLTTVEVDRLRLAAKRDAKLKAVLQKFTPHIEVEVEL